jgi:hypothetical protein
LQLTSTTAISLSRWQLHGNNRCFDTRPQRSNGSL